jgi:hypothetical protein
LSLTKNIHCYYLQNDKTSKLATEKRVSLLKIHSEKSATSSKLALEKIAFLLNLALEKSATPKKRDSVKADLPRRMDTKK